LVALIVAKLPGHPGLGHPETILAALAHGRFTSKYGLIKEDARHSSFVPYCGLMHRSKPLFKHLIGATGQGQRDSNAERFGGFEMLWGGWRYVS
jgi:hypothetical protein